MITIAPSTDVQAAQETVPPTSGSWVNPQHTFEAQSQRNNISTFAAPATKTIETAKDISALGTAERAMIDKLQINLIKPIDHLKAGIAAKFAETNTVDLVINKINNLDARKESLVDDVKDAEIADKSFTEAGIILTLEEKDKYGLAKEKLDIAFALVAEIEKIIIEIDSIITTPPTDEANYGILFTTIEDNIETFENLMKIAIGGTNKEIPTNLKMLGHAEQHISNVQELKDAHTTFDNAEKLEKDIAAISLTETITDHATSQVIRKRYNELSKIGQHFVGDITNLTKLEALHFESAAKTVINLITAIDIKMDLFVENVRKAVVAYESYTRASKKCNYTIK